MDARIGIDPGSFPTGEAWGKRLLDGGVSDPIPVKWMLSRGYEKNVVVLTRDVKYRKSKPEDAAFSESSIT